MILVTGGTGFVGKVLIRHLVESDYPVRTLIRASKESPDLPRGIPVDAAVSSLSDERGLRAAMVGVDTVYHLASEEWSGARADLMKTDILGTRQVVEAAKEVGVKRIFFLSHLDADRASAYPVLKAKAISEEYIRRSGLNYTIIRSAILYGPGDGLTSGLARILNSLPVFFFVPGDPKVLLQPLWVEDLATCMTWTLEDTHTLNTTIEVGGPEFITLQALVQMVMEVTGVHRRIVSLHPPYLRALTVLFESIFPGFPASVYWIDYLAANRTCALDTIPRIFGLLPARISNSLEYLRGQEWRQPLIPSLFRRRN